MNKKIVIPALATILMLVLLSAGPVFAGGPPEYYWQTRGTSQPPDGYTTPSELWKVWLTGEEGKTYHYRGRIRLTTYSGSLTTGDYEGYTGFVIDVIGCDINLLTMEGNCHGKGEITIVDGTWDYEILEDGNFEMLIDGEIIGTIGFSVRTRIFYPFYYGSMAGTHGTGAFEGVKLFSTGTGEVGVGSSGEGFIIWP